NNIILNANMSGTAQLTAGGGNTILNAGVTLIVQNASNISNAGTITLNGATLQTIGAMTLTNNMTLGSSGGTIHVLGSTLIYNGVIGGTGSLTKTGNAILRLGAANNY